MHVQNAQLWVHDQAEALDFYVGKLGLEVSADVDLGFMRWLTISIPGHPERQILLEKPGARGCRRRRRSRSASW